MFKTRKAEIESLRQAYQDACKLVAVSRNGSAMVLTFERNGEHFEVQTYAAMGLDLGALKARAGL